MIGNWHLLRAHTDSVLGRRDYLGEHLADVAAMAGRFAGLFENGRVGSLLGRLHDAGKAQQAFQNYLDRLEAGSKETSGPPHAIWGAALAYWVVYKVQGDLESWKELCLPIAGHHGGLAGVGDLSLRLEEFLKSQQVELKELAVTLRDARVLPRLERELEPLRYQPRVPHPDVAVRSCRRRFSCDRGALRAEEGRRSRELANSRHPVALLPCQPERGFGES